MSAESENANSTNGEAAEHQPFIPASQNIPEFTWPSLLVGTLLGIIFGASSLYLLLQVGMTVSASVPIAVLSITLFRAFSKWFGFRRATILENNVVQTAGSAGESIAFGVGVTMPALLLLGFEMQPIRVMTVSVLGGLLGILLMIPLRRAFIVKQHGKLKYPEGTACAEVLTAGERGGSSARMIFLGFGIAFVHKFLTKASKLWADEPTKNLFWKGTDGKTEGLKGAAASGELSPELMGVGYLIGPRIACMMMAGAVLSFFVIAPLIATFGETATVPVPPAESTSPDADQDKGLIRNMDPGDLYKHYLRYIGAGAVAAGGIISMLRAMPLIFGSIVAGFRDIRTSRELGGAKVRTEHDLPISVVFFGSILLVFALAAVPQLGLGLSAQGILGAVMILVFGFLFVTVSSRLTGEVGSSSNPISGMTIATLLLTCLIFVIFGMTGFQERLTALSIAAVVCIASSNGGTTSQDLKTGYLVGATPKFQQYAILLGTLTSAIVIGFVMLALNSAGTHYLRIKDEKIRAVVVKVEGEVKREKPGRPWDTGDHKDDNEYRVVFIRDKAYPGVAEGWYLIDDDSHPVYLKDVPINRTADRMDNPDDPAKEGDPAPEKFKAPQPQLFSIIIKGILGGDLQWTLVIAGALIAIALELMGVSALPVAVGMYLGLSTATPIFLGGLIRWVSDKWRGGTQSEAEAETSPGVLLGSGYIAGGTLCGLMIGFFSMGGKEFMDSLNTGAEWFGKEYLESPAAQLNALYPYLILAVILLWAGCRKSTEVPHVPSS